MTHKIRSILLPALAGLALYGAALRPAEAGVSVSVGINLPVAPGVVIGGVIHGGPAPRPRRVWGPPVVVAPVPVVYAPRVAVLPPPRVVYRPPVVYRPAPRVIVQPAPVYLVPGDRWRR